MHRVCANQIHGRGPRSAAAVGGDIARGHLVQRRRELDADHVSEALLCREHECPALARSEIYERIITRVDSDWVHDRLENRQLNRFIGFGLCQVLSGRSKSGQVVFNPGSGNSKLSIDALLLPSVVAMLESSALPSTTIQNASNCHIFLLA